MKKKVFAILFLVVVGSVLLNSKVFAVFSKPYSLSGTVYLINNSPAKVQAQVIGNGEFVTVKEANVDQETGAYTIDGLKTEKIYYLSVVDEEDNEFNPNYKKIVEFDPNNVPPVDFNSPSCSEN